MQIALRQVFPLGRFHATSWRANPFDDPYGEWPPSPWRLVRAVVARWYQWAREETPEPHSQQVDDLVRALCTSTYRFRLPTHARKGGPLRQYHPIELEMDPQNFKAFRTVFAMPAGGVSDSLSKRLTDAGAEEFRPGASKLFVCVSKSKMKKQVERVLGTPLEDWGSLRPDPGFRTYSTSLAQDNYWCVPCGDEGAVWWFLDGNFWTDEVITAVDRCLERITYFGRSETLTCIRRASEAVPEPNCELSERRTPGSVPVLSPSPNASRADVERVTDDPDAVKRSVPPGARMMYAVRPPPPPAREMPDVLPIRSDCRLLQFAIGWNVAPEVRAIVRLTSRFRGAVLRELLRIKTGDRATTWRHVEAAALEGMADMIGKDAHGKLLSGHRHAEFLAWCEDGVPTRLLVWRDGRPFDEDEQTAVLRAASRELSWAAAGPDADAWKVKLLPLDRAVPPPPGFDEAPARRWESVTPYVPPRHHLRGGKPRARESLVAQIRRELALRGFVDPEQVEAEQIGDPAWVAVHVPRRRAEERGFVGDRRGYSMRLTFPEPVKGPLRLGHSSSFGLGLFRPVLPA